MNMNYIFSVLRAVYLIGYIRNHIVVQNLFNIKKILYILDIKVNEGCYYTYLLFQVV